MDHKVATIINFCSNEYRFLKHCVHEAKQFSKVIITVCDRFFDGTEENLDLLSHVFSEFSDCQFVYYPYLLDRISKRLQLKIGDNFCCTLSRYIGYYYSEKAFDYLLFLDADEIVEGRRFNAWLDQLYYKDYVSMRLANYWYFRSSKYRAKNWEDSPVLAKRKALSKKVILQEGDRNAVFNNTKGKKAKMMLGEDQLPMVHHYSWVRTKEEMMKKVLSWGHRNERNWAELVEEEFSRPFNGTDFVHGYEFDQVEPFVTIDLKTNAKIKTRTNIEKISQKTLLKLVSSWRFSFL